MEDRFLRPLPAGFAATVAALHRVAEEVVSPARKPDNEIALEPTQGGFGTPEFEYEGARRRVRVEGDELVREVDGAEQRSPLGVDREAALALGRWYAFGAAALERLLDAARPEDEATPAHLWPEHFDLAIELGSEAAGARANYGASPGDESHPEPYLYVGPWSAAVRGELWRAAGFAGAELGYRELLAAPDAAAAADEFFAVRRKALNEIGRSAA